MPPQRPVAELHVAQGPCGDVVACVQRTPPPESARRAQGFRWL